MNIEVGKTTMSPIQCGQGQVAVGVKGSPKFEVNQQVGRWRVMSRWYDNKDECWCYQVLCTEGAVTWIGITEAGLEAHVGEKIVIERPYTIRITENETYIGPKE